jgi:hypothetical protein
VPDRTQASVDEKANEYSQAPNTDYAQPLLYTRAESLPVHADGFSSICFFAQTDNINPQLA